MAPPFPIPHILLKDIPRSEFQGHYTSPYTTQSPPQRFLGDDIPFPEQDEEMETCGLLFGGAKSEG
ncbi:unnamed protein product [Brassica napus]|uniref:(rape) hypothetical protein n=1 Tax=Brassica napus TaxID=3708 RepID=A0A816X7H3_BRANA|nr:unnamed protein product [Brassica napus]